MEKYITIKNIWKRLKSDSPTFFKRLSIWLAAISAMGLALIGFKAEYPEALAFFPDQLGGYMLAAGTFGIFLSKLTVADPEQSNIK